MTHAFLHTHRQQPPPNGTLLFLELKFKEVHFLSFLRSVGRRRPGWEAAVVLSCSFLSALFWNNSPGFEDIKMSARPFGPTLLQ